MSSFNLIPKEKIVERVRYENPWWVNKQIPELYSTMAKRLYFSSFYPFVIEKNGSLTDIKVLQNPGYGLDKEAIRVLKSLKTKWEPGIKNGNPVRTAFSLPIIIRPE
jgi:protein TonB